MFFNKNSKMIQIQGSAAYLYDILSGITCFFYTAYLNSASSDIVLVVFAFSIIYVFTHILFSDFMGVPYVKCPTCAAEGVEVWVIFGKCCPRCGTACD